MDILDWFVQLQGIGTELGLGNSIVIVCLAALVFLGRLEAKRLKKKFYLLHERDVGKIIAQHDVLWEERSNDTVRAIETENAERLQRCVDVLWKDREYEKRKEKSKAKHDTSDIEKVVIEKIAELLKERE